MLREAPIAPILPSFVRRPPRAPDGTPFKIVSEFQPAGDQPQAIADLIAGVGQGERDQVLLGVTGSGKTFTMAHVIQHFQRPTLILAPNKTLAAQLYGEMKSFFPENAVEYFVSYYDYYQPEAYVRSEEHTSELQSPVHLVCRLLLRRPPTSTLFPYTTLFRSVTGSGKTFTMAHVIQHFQRPTLILAPNKTLAAQLYGEMKSFFPENAVEYFVSYYDYYQPEAYV